MHDGVGLKLFERGTNGCERIQIAFDKLGASIDRGSMAFGKVIEDGHRVSLIKEQLGAHAADVAGAANDQNLHRESCRAAARDVNYSRGRITPSVRGLRSSAG